MRPSLKTKEWSRDTVQCKACLHEALTINTNKKQNCHLVYSVIGSGFNDVHHI